MKVYACDFETTTIETCKNETWVWSYGIRELYSDKFLFGTNIDDFMKWVMKSTKHIYFHNLKFDGHSIISYLLLNGFEHNPTKKAKEKTFKTIITKEGLFYEIDICWYENNGNVKHAVIQDSYKKLPFTIDRIAKSFKMPFKKGDIDYKKVRPKGYILNRDELDYLRRDVDILCRALEIQYDEGLEKQTIGSDALNQFKEIISKQKFDNLFPNLDVPHEGGESDITVDDWVRKSYKGGYTYVNPIHQGKPIEHGKVYDVNSLYPAVMYYKSMPWGEPVYVKGQYKENEIFPLYIQKLSCEFELKEGYLPTIQIKGGRFADNEYLETSTEIDEDGKIISKPVELTLTSVDLQLFFDHYDVKVHEWIECYMFRSIDSVFNEYIDKYMAIKKVETGAKRELAKLLLNNLYGKFASSTDGTMKIPYLDENGVVKMKTSDYVFKKSIYTPVGSFITSYAREITIRSAQQLGERFIYADTDSLHMIGLDIPNIDIDPVELGKWKFEGDFVRAKFLRAKTYIEDICIDEDENETTFDKMTDVKTKVTCAGMNDKIKNSVDENGNKLVNFETFKYGSKFYGKLVPKVIKGGVVLVDDYFTLKL